MKALYLYRLKRSSTQKGSVMKKNIYKILSFSIVTFSTNSFCTFESIRSESTECHTWSGNTFKPATIFYPNSIEDVQEIIRNAIKTDKKIRFFGSRHSLNDLIATNGYAVNTDSFNKILEINQKMGTVRVECGIKLKQLFKELAKNNLALLNQGFIKEQSIAGALATGTHGSGKTGTLSDFIVSVELLDGLGKYHVISADSNPQWLQAARLHLGTLGFVYAVTLQCVPLFVLSHARKAHTWHDIFENLEQYYLKNDYFMLMAHPISDNVLAFTWNVSQEKPTNNFFINLTQKLLMNEITNYLGIKFIHWQPGLTNDFIDHFFKAMEQTEYREYSYKTLSPIKDPLEETDYIEEEIAIPMQYFRSAIEDIVALYNKYKKHNFELVGFMTCRFVKGSRKALLSPAYDQDSVYISLVTLSIFDQYQQFYAEFEKLMSKYQHARPHWGKFNQLTQTTVAALYQNNLTQFNAIRAILDPYKLFTNNYVEQRLG